MRLLVRFALAILLCLLLIVACEYLNVREYVIPPSDPSTDEDEVVRILLVSDDRASGREKNVTFNMAIVLIISLFSVFLLVMGIVLITWTLDSSIVDDESYYLDEAPFGLQSNQKVCAGQFLSPSDRLPPQI